ncbi:MAG: SDR family NAD(P)-dependent oxidoreductase [Ignavibacteriales bacterium]|nr:SDR family NAD(P)-dependent oxidoreductase [Ignavibacteriales bacterium]
MPLIDKIALVLGGTGGLGSSITQRLASEGCRVYATYKSESGLQPAAALTDSGKLIQADVTDERQVHLLFDTIISESKNVHIVVNTVGGYLPRKPLRDVTEHEWDLMMNINLKSAFLCTREALRRMDGQSYGRIIHISAMTGLRPVPERIPYSVSKASVVLLIELVAQEVKGTGITVNAIAPDVIATSANLVSASGEDTSKWVTPEQIADIILSLCSPASATINGTTIRAFGGL